MPPAHTASPRAQGGSVWPCNLSESQLPSSCKMRRLDQMKCQPCYSVALLARCSEHLEILGGGGDRRL